MTWNFFEQDWWEVKDVIWGHNNPHFLNKCLLIINAYQNIFQEIIFSPHCQSFWKLCLNKKMCSFFPFYKEFANFLDFQQFLKTVSMILSAEKKTFLLKLQKFYKTFLSQNMAGYWTTASGFTAFNYTLVRKLKNWFLEISKAEFFWNKINFFISLIFVEISNILNETQLSIFSIANCLYCQLVPR